MRNLLHFANAAVDVVNQVVAAELPLTRQKAINVRHRLACAATALHAAADRLEMLRPDLRNGRKKDKRTEPDYSYRDGEYVRLAPEVPLLHLCPDCTENEKSVKAYLRKTYRLTYLRSLGETWGCVVTRHDVYRCRNCREKWVSTNGREPEVAAPDI